MPELETVRTVLELDLASYADVARVLEENLDVAAVKAFEDQIQLFVDRALESVGLRRTEVVVGTAGDNAILIFDRPQLMHEFARLVHEATVTQTSPRPLRPRSVGSAWGQPQGRYWSSSLSDESSARQWREPFG